VLVEIAVCPLAVEVGQLRVVRAASRDHHVVDPHRQVLEEPIESGRIGGVEGRDLQRTEFRRGSLETLGIPAGQDDAGALGASPSGRLQPNARTAPDHDDGLSG
jgi:hypothetical protein